MTVNVHFYFEVIVFPRAYRKICQNETCSENMTYYMVMMILIYQVYGGGLLVYHIPTVNNLFRGHLLVILCKQIMKYYMTTTYYKIYSGRF